VQGGSFHQQLFLKSKTTYAKPTTTGNKEHLMEQDDLLCKTSVLEGIEADIVLSEVKKTLVHLQKPLGRPLS